MSSSNFLIDFDGLSVILKDYNFYYINNILFTTLLVENTYVTYNFNLRNETKILTFNAAWWRNFPWN